MVFRLLSGSFFYPKMTGEQLVHFFKRLRYDLRAAYCRHEVCIALPPWHDVPVYVVCNPGAGSRAQVKTNVKSMRVYKLLVRLDTVFYCDHNIRHYVFRNVREF